MYRLDALKLLHVARKKCAIMFFSYIYRDFIKIFHFFPIIFSQFKKTNIPVKIKKGKDLKQEKK